MVLKLGSTVSYGLLAEFQLLHHMNRYLQNNMLVMLIVLNFILDNY